MFARAEQKFRPRTLAVTDRLGDAPFERAFRGLFRAVEAGIVPAQAGVIGDLRPRFSVQSLGPGHRLIMAWLGREFAARVTF